MSLFNKSDMVYDNYYWTARPDDNPNLRGMPDSSLLNRMEGYEVLHFINKFAERNGIKDVEKCKQIEKIIRDAPSDKRSHEHIDEYIKKLLKLS